MIKPQSYITKKTASTNMHTSPCAHTTLKHCRQHELSVDHVYRTLQVTRVACFVNRATDTSPTAAHYTFWSVHAEITSTPMSTREPIWSRALVYIPRSVFLIPAQLRDCLLFFLFPFKQVVAKFRQSFSSFPFPKASSKEEPVDRRVCRDQAVTTTQTSRRPHGNVIDGPKASCVAVQNECEKARGPGREESVKTTTSSLVVAAQRRTVALKTQRDTQNAERLELQGSLARSAQTYHTRPSAAADNG